MWACVYVCACVGDLGEHFGIQREWRSGKCMGDEHQRSWEYGADLGMMGH